MTVVTETPLPKKTNPNTNPPIDDVDADNKIHMFPFYFLMMMPNTIGSFVRSYRRNDNDYSMAVFGLLVFSVFLLVDYFLVKYLSLPKDEKSSRKFWLKVTMWVLYTEISFGSVYLFSYFLSSQVTVALYAVMFICSAVLLNAFVIGDRLGDWKIRRCETVDAGKSKHAYSVLEQV